MDVYFIGILILITNSIWITNSARILFVPAHSFASHAKSMYPPAEALKNAGHDVFLLQLIIEQETETKNNAGVVDLVIHQVPLKSNRSEEEIQAGSQMVWNSGRSQATLLSFAWIYIGHICCEILSNDETRKKWDSIWSHHWDMVLMDDLAPCGLEAIKNVLINRNVIIGDFTLVPPSSLDIRGSVVPIGEQYFELVDQKGFLNRLGTTIHGLHYIVEMFHVDYQLSNMHNRLIGIDTGLLSRVRKIEIDSLPTGLEITHPRSHDFAEFDSECPIGNELPVEFKTFLDDPSSKGTILFSMGHYVDWTAAPSHALDSFLHTFSNLKEYRIIWQFNAKFNLENISSNILVRWWIPQTAILNHPNTKLFISHMGIKSTRETICAGVPVVATPIVADQFRNAIIAQQRGFGVYLDKWKLTRENVEGTIRRVLDNSSYTNAVHRLQNQLSDRIRNSSSLFTFQINYIIRRNDEGILGKYIRPNGRKMKNFIYWMGDISMIIVGSLFVLGYLVI